MTGSARSCARGARRSSSARWSRSPRLLQARAATAEFERLRDGELRDFRVVLMHGQLRPADKQEAMARVRRRRGRRAGRDLGDRGRDRRPERDRDAGRGRRPLRDLAAAPAARADRPRRARVAVPAVRAEGLARGCARSAEHADGFELAEIDLELRGEGELVGTRQHGLAAVPGRRAAARRRAARAGAAARASGSSATIPSSTLPEHALLADALDARLRGRGARRRSGREASMRVIAGVRRAHAGRAARARDPPDLGPGARGAVLDPRRRSTGARVLDLFAGSGALAIEALSRGAAAGDAGRLLARPRSRRSGATCERSG